MNLGRLSQLILKSDKEISGYGQLAQHVIFAYHMVQQTPLIALPPSALPCITRIFSETNKQLIFPPKILPAFIPGHFSAILV